MCRRIVESMMIKNGILCNIVYHNRRLTDTCRDFFKAAQLSEVPDITDLIKTEGIPEIFRKGIVKCRLLYDFSDGRFSSSFEYAHYRRRSILSLKLVEGSPDYQFKYTDRSALDELMKKRNGCDDIIIVKNGLLTDASSANIVLLKDGKRFTPAEPLLKGTARAKLLDEGIIYEADIRAEDIPNYKGAILINAMLPLDEQPVIPVAAIEPL